MGPVTILHNDISLTPLGLVHRLGGTRNGSGWKAHCPAHNDRKESLSLNLGDDQRLLFRCHAGCSQDQVLGALGVPWSALFPAPARASKTKRALASITIYELSNDSGVVVAEHIRRELPGGAKSFSWRRNGTPGLKGLRAEDLPLYGLPAVLQAARDSAVVVVEGEKSRVPGSGVRGRGSGERETTASSLAGKQQAREKEDNGGQGKDGPAGAIAQGGNGR